MSFNFYKKILFYLRVRILRGSKLLKRSKNPYIFSKFEENLANDIKNNSYSLVDRVYYQYIFRSLNYRLKKFYLYCYNNKKRLIFPLPIEWLKNVEIDLIKVNKFFSIFLFIGYSLLHIPKCFKTILKILISKSVIKEKSIVLCDVNNSRLLPHERYNHFFLKIIKENFNLNYDFIYHKCKNIYDKPLIYCNNFFPLTYLSKLKLTIWFSVMLVVNILKVFILKPKSLILFKEEIFNKQLTYYHQSNGIFALKYFFLIHSFDFRPLWTYNKSIRDRIVIINEPSSFYGFKDHRSLEYPKKQFSQILNNWHYQLLFNKHYFEYIKNLNPNLEIKLGKKATIEKNYLSLSDIDNNKFYVAIFDITPMRKYFRGTFLSQDDYRIGKVCVNFIEDIIQLSEELKFEVIWKQKRKKNLRRDNKYYWFIAEKYKKFCIDSNYSAKQIAQVANVSVCAPFTSAAFFENKSGRLDSVFYDPINKILKDDRGAQGQNVLNGYYELKKHLQTEMKKKFD